MLKKFKDIKIFYILKEKNIMIYTLSVLLVAGLLGGNIYLLRQKNALKGTLDELRKMSSNLPAIRKYIDTVQKPSAISHKPYSEKQMLEAIDEIKIKTRGDITIQGHLKSDAANLIITIRTKDFNHVIKSLIWLRNLKSPHFHVTTFEGTQDGKYIIKGHLGK